ncbi:fatty acid desaturase family protein [Cognatishimia sp. WU-CL00825]|uniref:fatty acid desaturase n=1 Tax=Cognatishimia sp. WU-CL00825 TaxID=3127658 RepID=UPI003105D441
MDHKTFVGSLDRSDLAALMVTRDRPGMVHLAGHIALIVIGSFWILRGWFLWPFVLVIQGVVISFLFTLEHEATHKTPFKTKWINEAAGWLSGLLILQPFFWFRCFHMAHHRHTNIPGKDPELMSGYKPEGRAAFVWYLTGIPYWIGMTRQIWRNAKGKRFHNYVPERAYPRVTREARIMLAFYGVSLLSLAMTGFVFWVWILPTFLGMPFLRLYLLAEHGRCAYVANMFENTRTTYTTRFVRFIAWNMPYHVEHHTIPAVPFHQLSVLHKTLEGHHVVTSDGYTGFAAEYLRETR